MTHRLTGERLRDMLARALYIASGLLLAALGYRLFLIPNDIAPGGFTGMGQLINALTGYPVGAVVLALNVPLFALGLRSMGVRFALGSLVATLALSAMLDWLPTG